MPKTTAPKTATLSGRAYECYRAGTDMGSHHAYTDAANNLRQYKSHLEQQLLSLRTALVEDPTYPIPEDHPLRSAVDALPGLAGGVEAVAAQCNAQASIHQTAGTQTMGKVAAMGEAQTARWRPPLRAWGMLTLAIVLASTVATVAATYAIRGGW